MNKNRFINQGAAALRKCLKQSLVIVSREDYQRSRRIKLKKEWLKSIRLKYDHKFGYKFGEKYLEKMRKVVYNNSTRIKKKDGE